MTMLRVNENIIGARARHAQALSEYREEIDRALVKGALAGPDDPCPYKRNTREGKMLAARWAQGHAVAETLRQ